MTRPRAASERFVQALPPESYAKVTPVFSPLIEIQPTVDAVDLAPFQGIIFSSANGVSVASGLTDRRDLPCFCVGAATTRAAGEAGWSAECAGRTADMLVETLSARIPNAPLIHLRGVAARGEIAKRLSTVGCDTHEYVIYDQRLLSLTAEAEDALNRPQPVVVPLFSPRTARHFASLGPFRAPLFLSALSTAVAKPLFSLESMALEVTSEPTAEAMVKTLGGIVETAIRLEGGRGAQ